ncbi:hypothetical protein CGLO_12040 [Colletotrichum gloeosporioides Cg-14]|nr:hypothetical protein CGLO_12040 [Colletotrichum gloeosporioides Cg-14]
MDDPKLT